MIKSSSNSLNHMNAQTTGAEEANQIAEMIEAKQDARKSRLSAGDLLSLEHPQTPKPNPKFSAFGV
jgi:hypothetical protein